MEQTSLNGISQVQYSAPRTQTPVTQPSFQGNRPEIKDGSKKSMDLLACAGAIALAGVTIAAAIKYGPKAIKGIKNKFTKTASEAGEKAAKEAGENIGKSKPHIKNVSAPDSKAANKIKNMTSVEAETYYTQAKTNVENLTSSIKEMQKKLTGTTEEVAQAKIKLDKMQANFDSVSAVKGADKKAIEKAKNALENAQKEFDIKQKQLDDLNNTITQTKNKRQKQSQVIHNLTEYSPDVKNNIALERLNKKRTKRGLKPLSEYPGKQ